MIRSWGNGAEDGGTIGNSSTCEESPLPEQAVAKNDNSSPLCEGPLLTALLNKMETILDQVCIN